MALILLRPWHGPTLPSWENGETLSSEKKAIQRLLRTCGLRSRTMCESILLDLIVFSRISPEIRRHLNILSPSHLIFQASPDIRSAVIPLSTLVDSIFSANAMVGLSCETRKLLNVWNLIGQKNGISAHNFLAIVGPSTFSHFFPTLSWLHLS